VTESEKLARAVAGELKRQVPELSRASLIKQCLDDYALIIVTRDMVEACDYANRLAPEHLEIQTERPEEVLQQIRNAGAVFVGPQSPVAVGDYVAGPSHVLPTGGSARSFSGLSAADFLRGMSVIECSADGLAGLAPDVIKWANIEGLTAHARSVELRLREKTPGTES